VCPIERCDFAKSPCLRRKISVVGEVDLGRLPASRCSTLSVKERPALSLSRLWTLGARHYGRQPYDERECSQLRGRMCYQVYSAEIGTLTHRQTHKLAESCRRPRTVHVPICIVSAMLPMPHPLRMLTIAKYKQSARAVSMWRYQLKSATHDIPVSRVRD
jgi:hypothetical protein